MAVTIFVVIVLIAALSPRHVSKAMLGAGLSIGMCMPCLLVCGLTMALFARARYEPSARTSSFERILEPLVTSTEEYCLVLRPFGSDGATVVPRRPRLGYLSPTMTLEQVVARAMRDALGMKTYAMVDQDRDLAPPGPVYLRAPHSEWRNATKVLIRRAHTIVLLLPPGQGIREALAWEIRQITDCNFQARVITVLPPCGRRDDLQAYAAARERACVVLATLEEFAGAVDEADPTKIDHYRRLLPDTTLLVKLGEADNPLAFDRRNVRFWSVPGPRARRRLIAFPTYAGGLSQAAKLTAAEMSGLSFAARYPWPFFDGGRGRAGSAPRPG